MNETVTKSNKGVTKMVDIISLCSCYVSANRPQFKLDKERCCVIQLITLIQVHSS